VSLYREHIVQIGMKEQCSAWLGTSSCTVCSISYSWSANVAGEVEVGMVIVVERCVLLRLVEVTSRDGGRTRGASSVTGSFAVGW